MSKEGFQKGQEKEEMGIENFRLFYSIRMRGSKSRGEDGKVDNVAYD